MTEQNIGIGIRRIRDIAFSVNEESPISDPNKQIKIDIQHKIRLDGDTLLTMILRIIFYYPEFPENILIESKIENTFEIINLKEYVKDDGITFAEEIWVTIVSLSISHARALIAKQLAGTIYHATMIPIVDPVKITRSFFPQYQAQSENQPK